MVNLKKISSTNDRNNVEVINYGRRFFYGTSWTLFVGFTVKVSVG